MSPRSARSSGSLASKPPALIRTPTSSPTPLTSTVTAPPETVPSTVVSDRRAWALCSCSCICWACWSRAFMSKPPPPRASKGFSVMVGITSRSGRRTAQGSWVADLVDHLGAELAAQQLGGVEALVLGVEVVGACLGVGGGQVLRAGVGRGATALAGLLDRPARGGDGAGVAAPLGCGLGRATGPSRVGGGRAGGGRVSRAGGGPRAAGPRAAGRSPSSGGRAGRSERQRAARGRAPRVAPVRAGRQAARPGPPRAGRPGG